MSKLKILGLAIVLVLIVILAGGYGYIRHIAARGIPDYETETVLKGLSAEVTVFRDNHAVPHIYAKNETDLYMAVGYCMAQDRMFQMDLMRRLTMGRLSEIVGEKAVAADHLMRALRIPDKSRKMISRTDPALLQSMDAFCSGVNQYIDNHRGRLPLEFTLLGYVPEKWRPVHAFNMACYMAWDLSTGWDTEVTLHQILEKIGKEKMELIMPDMSIYDRSIYPDFHVRRTGAVLDAPMLAGGRMLEELGLTVFSGSNNWVVSGKRSVTGKPILANDMHLSLFAPGIWYQMHQVAEESGLNVTGVVVPGQPLVTCGHNDHIAWGFTNVMVDDMDFYLEKINPDNPHEYEFNDAWRKMEVRRERIGIKGGTFVEKEILFTHRGPIVSEFKKLSDKALSIRWTGNAYSNESRTLYLLGKARNWDDFKNAARTFNAVSQNMVYADVEGNIGLYCSAGVPIREKGTGPAILPGWTDRYDWKGFVPFEELPHAYNPESGSLCSANNKTTGDDYPHYISTWYAPDHRFRRIEEMLASKETFSIGDFKKMQADWKSKMVEDMQPDIVAVVKNTDDLSPLEKKCISLFENWDGVMTGKSTSATLFEVFYVSLMRNIFEDEMGEELYDKFLTTHFVVNLSVEKLWADRDSPWYDNVSTRDHREGFDAVVRKSFGDAVARLESKLGDNPDKWRWDKVHQLTLNHPLGSVGILDRVFGLNRGPYPIGGSSHTVSPYKYNYTKPFGVVHGASHRHIYSLSDWNDSLTIIPTGTCGVPASKYYCDQTGYYLSNRYHPDYVERDRVEKSATYVMKFVAR